MFKKKSQVNKENLEDVIMSPVGFGNIGSSTGLAQRLHQGHGKAGRTGGQAGGRARRVGRTGGWACMHEGEGGQRRESHYEGPLAMRGAHN